MRRWVLVSMVLTGMAGCDNDVAPTFTGELADCAGAYAGSFSGDDQGNLSGTMATDGTVTGILIDALSGPADLTAIISPQGRFLGTADTGALFEGQLTNDCAVSGTWRNGGSEGTWSAIALFTGELADCAGAYAGSFSGDDQGNLSATLATDRTVTGTLVSPLFGPADLMATISPEGRFLGTAGTGVLLEGQLANDCVVTGTWRNGIFDGSWSATRLPD